MIRSAPYQFGATLLALLLLGSSVSAAATDETNAPWPKRKRSKDARLAKTGWGVLDLAIWPTEPFSPDVKSLDNDRFARALTLLCPKLPATRAAEYARWIVTYARQFSVDPMLLGALVYQEGRCRRHRRVYASGLTKLPWDSHRRHWDSERSGYRFWLPSKRGPWEQHLLELPKFPFSNAVVRRPEPNLYFAAALLSIYQRQCPHIDRSHGVSVPHRHPVSHFIWGDRVVSTHEESRVLIARRRLIRHYTGKASPLRGNFKGRPLMSPLEGPPRKLTGAWGDPRGPKRLHKGVDFSSTMAEPVRAIADGTVWMAGADLNERPTASFSPRAATQLSRAILGRAGLLVLLDHGGGLTSGYMHLLRYTVRTGEKVSAGQIIGFVGRSGVKTSSAHLHFEVRVDGSRVDPLPLLGPLVISPLETRAGRWRQRKWESSDEGKRRIRRAAANARWRERMRQKKRKRKGRAPPKHDAKNTP